MNRDEIIECIQEAFKDVSREDGVSLHEGLVMDAYGSDEERLEARRMDTEGHWSQISDQELIKYQNALRYFDRKSFKYYVPAYMIFSLNHSQTSPAGSNDNVIYDLTLDSRPEADSDLDKGIFANLNIDYDELRHNNRDRFNGFNHAQSVAIAKYLQYCSKNEMRGFHSAAAKEALEGYWKDYLK